MAKRRFQNPHPQCRGAWWTMRVWRDEFIDGKHVRKQQRVRLAAATVPEREVKKVATEYLRPLNQGLESLGSATNFEHFIETIYKPVVKPLMATTSFDRTRGILDNYLVPAFGKCSLRDLTTLTLQTYFSKLTTGTANQPLSHESRDKIRDVLSSALRFAVQHDSSRVASHPAGQAGQEAQQTLSHTAAVRHVRGSDSRTVCFDGVRRHLYGATGQRTGGSALE